MYRFVRMTGVRNVSKEALILVLTPFLFYCTMKKCTKKLNFIDEEFLPNLEKQKEFILNTFDFEQVAKVMSTPVKRDYFTGMYDVWKISNKIGYSIPTIEVLKELAISLMNAAIKADDNIYIISSGPFKVTKIYGRLTLDFRVTSGSYD